MTRTAPPPLDRLSGLLGRFPVRAALLQNGPLCGVSRFTADRGRGFLHVMKRGELELRHGGRSALPRRLAITEPTLLFYPRPLAHEFRNPVHDGSDFVCAELVWSGGELNPLVRALPPLMVLPLARVPGLAPALDLLFAETEALRCGQRVLADRLFEVVVMQLLRWLVDHPSEGGLPEGLLAALADARLARALVALHDAPGQAWSLAALAAQAGMSRSAFAAAFKARVGAAPAEYLADWRLCLAQGQLQQGRPVKAIADELGYASASAFSRRFAQRVGRSPTQWLSEAASVTS